MPTPEDKQLNILFDTKTTLTDLLYKSDFFVQIECRPESDGSLSSQTIALAKSASQILPEDKLSFMATSIRPDGFSASALETARKLQDLTSRPVTMVLSGQGRTLHDLKTDAASAKSNGIVNLFAVTGNIAPDHVPDAKGNYLPYTRGYMDSLDTLAAIKAFLPDVSLGAAVNPFKYTPEDQCLQYAKMFRKCAAGADFIVTQAGWDMKKYQELQWFMQMRELVKPVLARIPFLSFDQAQNLSEGYFAGQVIPLPVASALQRHANSEAEFMTYQCELLALQTLGLKFLGYNGIQITGLYYSSDFRQFWEKYEALSAIVTSYPEWLRRWHNFHGDISFAPAPTFHSQSRPHYFFANLLEGEPLNYDAEASQLASATLEQPAWLEKFKASLIRPGADGKASRMARKFFKQGDEKTYGLDNSSCPKRLTLCPCGNSRSDGYCEANHAPCVFKKVVELSAAFNEMNLLE
ncbi:MAG: methylenetetrahydrofolate reductase C-terminal domain-containing protein [Victivallales bacterium]|nr:methylenetetrahydrofolate reductase C-terminal domain-containing protein [Victivallales bacterium]